MEKVNPNYKISGKCYSQYKYFKQKGDKHGKVFIYGGSSGKNLSRSVL
jgi:hypothetical protein